MGFTAYLAHKRGENPWLWGALAYVLTVATPLVLLFVTRRKRVTLNQYLERYPRCRMKRGIRLLQFEQYSALALRRSAVES